MLIPRLSQKDFLTLADFTREEVLSLVNLARDLKKERQAGVKREPLLAGKKIALIFEKTSTRTRCAFEVAAFDEGAHTTYLDSAGSQIGHKESIKDTARVLSALYDGIEYRGFGQNIVAELAQNASVPVLNGLTEEWHPTQMLADLMTMLECSGKEPEAISFAYLGDARYNMGNSLLHLGALMGMDVRIAAPRALWPDADLVRFCQELAKTSGVKITLTESASEAVKNVDFIHTDIWVSMGEASDVWAKRIELLKPYRIDRRLIDSALNPNVKLMHCLPAYHNRDTTIGEQIYQEFGLDGVEVTDEVFESFQETIFQQAGNRMHTIKAVLVTFLQAK